MTHQQIDPQMVEDLCEVMHLAYEDAAKAEGWETQERSRKPWADVPEANKATMRAAVTAMLRSEPMDRLVCEGSHDHPASRQRDHLIQGLVGRELAWVYHNSPQFKAKIEFLSQLLPEMVEGIARRAKDEDLYFRQSLAVAKMSPISPDVAEELRKSEPGA